MKTVLSITDKVSVQWSKIEVDLNENMVRLKTLVTGISAGTEGMWYDGSAPALVSGRRSYPYTPGYELVGVVEAIGEGIAAAPEQFPRLSGLKIGDRVFAFKPHSSHADITESDMWALVPEHVANENALGLALSCTCIHAMHRTGHGLGEHGAVLGLGVVGMIMIQMLKASGAGGIIASTRSAEKIALAEAFGATKVVDATVEGAKLPLCETVYECSGTTGGIYSSTKLAASQARIAGVGFYTEDIKLSGEDVFAKELTIVGVRASGAAGDRSEFIRWPRSENLKLASSYLAEDKLRLDKLVSHRIKPEEIQDAYEIIRTKSEPYMLMVMDWS